MLINLNERAHKAQDMYKKADEAAKATQATFKEELALLAKKEAAQKKELQTKLNTAPEEAVAAINEKAQKELANLEKSRVNVKKNIAELSEKEALNLEKSRIFVPICE